jgi:hypothetical protein
VWLMLSRVSLLCLLHLCRRGTLQIGLSLCFVIRDLNKQISITEQGCLLLFCCCG